MIKKHFEKLKRAFCEKKRLRYWSWRKIYPKIWGGGGTQCSLRFLKSHSQSFAAVCSLRCIHYINYILHRVHFEQWKRIDWIIFCFIQSLTVYDFFYCPTKNRITGMYIMNYVRWFAGFLTSFFSPLIFNFYCHFLNALQ